MRVLYSERGVVWTGRAVAGEGGVSLLGFGGEVLAPDRVLVLALPHPPADLAAVYQQLHEAGYQVERVGS